MKYRIQIANDKKELRHVDLEGQDAIDIAVQLVKQLGEGETYKKVAYAEQVSAPSPDDKIILRVDGMRPTEHATLEEAQAEVAKLEPDVGYDILAEDPLNGTKDYKNTPTKVVEQRPSLKDHVAFDGADDFVEIKP